MTIADSLGDVVMIKITLGVTIDLFLLEALFTAFAIRAFVWLRADAFVVRAKFWLGKWVAVI